jgi:hypothetical protein
MLNSSGWKQQFLSKRRCVVWWKHIDVSFETSICFHQTTQRHFVGDITHNDCCYLQQYDYSYDYHDPEDPAHGVKPTEQEKPSTPSASDSSTETTLTPSTAVLLDSAKTTLTAGESASTTAAVGTESNNKTTTYTESPGVKKESSEGGDKQQTSVPPIAMLLPHQGSARRRCSPGFFRDSRGRCRRQRKPGYLALQTLPLDLPWVQKLSLVVEIRTAILNWAIVQPHDDGWVRIIYRHIPKYSEKNLKLPWSHFAEHISEIDDFGIDPGSPRREVSD